MTDLGLVPRPATEYRSRLLGIHPLLGMCRPCLWDRDVVPSREEAAAADAADPLCRFRREFRLPTGVVYLDGNSLGPPSTRVLDALAGLQEQWGTQLVTAWDEWVDLPMRTGDSLGSTLLGAATGQVVVCDSTTINLFKLVAAALTLQPDRSTIVVDGASFPTDRYIVDHLGADVREVEGGPLDAALEPLLDTDVALVVLSAVDYRTAELADIAAVTSAAHATGALVLWDLSHAVGVLPLDLDRSDVDFAVGCTYKYVNAGPGSPAFLYVRHDLQDVAAPIPGWFGHADQFAMEHRYRPAPGVARFLTGTPNVPGTVAVAAAVDLLRDASITAIRDKSVALTQYAIELADRLPPTLGFGVASPRDPARRGSHVALRHPEASAVCDALRKANVITDHRPPDIVRVGLAPLYTRFIDVWDAFEAIASR